MRHFHWKNAQHFNPTVNVDRLWSLVSEQTRAKFAPGTDNKGKAPVIDVTRAGFTKVLGKGPIPKIPVIVKARFFSERAEKKIKAAGGVCLLTA